MTATLVVTGGHAFARDSFAEMLDSFEEADCTQVEQPAAQRFFAPDEAERWDSFLLYDMPGYVFSHDGKTPQLEAPPARFREDFTRLVDRGHGFVFLHHALASWSTWEEYGDVVGGRYNFLRTPERPDSGYRHAVPQHISVELPEHPVVDGLGAGFDITDEVYLAETFDEQITPLLKTDAVLTSNSVWSTWNAVRGQRNSNEGWTHPGGSGTVAWVRRHPRSRIVYIQFGDGPAAFSNPAFRRLLSNALRWVSDRSSR